MARKILSADEKKAKNEDRRRKEKIKRDEKAIADREKAEAEQREKIRKLEEEEKKQRRKAADAKRRAEAKARKDAATAKAAQDKADTAERVREQVEEQLAKSRTQTSNLREKVKKEKRKYFDDDFGLELTRAEWLEGERRKKNQKKADALSMRASMVKANKGGGVRSTIYTRSQPNVTRIAHVSKRGELKDKQIRVAYPTDTPAHPRDIYVPKRSNFVLKYGNSNP